MRWLRYGMLPQALVHDADRNLIALEIAVASSPDDAPHAAPTHDILEVNDYLLSCLYRSQIDRWFSGDAATFSPQDFGVPDEKQDLLSVMQRARLALQDRTTTDLYHVGMRRCGFIFHTDRIYFLLSMSP